MLWIILFLAFSSSVLAFPHDNYLADALQLDVVNGTGEGDGSHLNSLDVRAKTRISVTAYPFKNDYFTAGYYFYVTVNGVRLSVLADTGSHWFWVLSTKVDDPRYANYQKIDWDPNDDCKERETYQYVDNTVVTGVLVQRTVQIGARPFNFPLLSASSLYEEEEEEGASGATEDVVGLDGIFGMDAKGLALTSRKLVSLDFRGQVNSKISFGDLIIDSRKSVTLKTVPLVSREWIVEIPKLRYVDIDSGTSSLVLPEWFIREYVGSLDAHKSKKAEWLINCNQNFPTMTIPFGAKDVHIPGSILKTKPSKDEPGYCESLIEQSAANVLVSYLGVPFVEQKIVFFDAQNMEITVQDR